MSAPDRLRDAGAVCLSEPYSTLRSAVVEAAKKHVKWVGNSPRQVIALPDGSDAFCDHGKSVEVAADVAESLLEQEGWEPGSKPRPKKSDDAGDGSEEKK